MSLFIPEKNCWRVTNCSAGEFLIDGKAYFEDLYHAFKLAEKSIFILGWSIDSRMKLIVDRKLPKEEEKLSQLLRTLVERKPQLEVKILAWGFFPIYHLNPSFIGNSYFGWGGHPRIKFIMDNQHPLGGSHHQKIVVIDDRIAYCGGLDITSNRWDTRKHLLRSKFRRDPSGKPYSPFHDVQMRLEGETAQAFGDLARFRWLLATGEQLETAVPANAAYTKSDLPASFTNAPIAISRTQPEINNEGQVAEVEKSYVDLINVAKKFIYIENQYFTSKAITEALTAALAKSDGPEIAIVLPKKLTWMEKRFLLSLQNKMLLKLFKEDIHKRLGVYYPRITRGGVGVKVHSKVMIVDDLYARVGSANLTNRSMGFDTECDVTLDASSNLDLQSAVIDFRADLISEHLDLEPAEAKTQLLNASSVNSYIKAHFHRDKCLKELKIKKSDSLFDLVLSDTELMDLREPLFGEMAISLFARELVKRPDQKLNVLIRLWVAFVLLVLATSFLMNHTPIGAMAGWNRFPDLLDHAKHYVQSWPLVVMGIYVVGSLVFIPINTLIILTASVADFGQAVALSMIGTILAGLLTFAIGKWGGFKFAQRLFPRTTSRLSERLKKGELYAVTLLRFLPIASFSAVNVALGSIGVKWMNFLLGSLFEILPSIFFLTVFQKVALDVLFKPTFTNAVLLTFLGTTMITIIYLTKIKWFRVQMEAMQGAAEINLPRS